MIIVPVIEEIMRLYNKNQSFVKILSIVFSSKSNGGEIFFFLLRHAFNTKNTLSGCLKKLTPTLQ